MMYLILAESPHSDTYVKIKRTVEAANECMDALIVEAKNENDRTVSITISVIDDTNPDVEILNGQPGCREWYGSWDSHWAEADALMPEPEPDPEDRPRYHAACGMTHGPDDCER